MKQIADRAARLLTRAAADRRRTMIGLYAANGAYYLFLSLVPLIALVLSLLPYTALREQQLLDTLLSYAPEQFTQLVYVIVSNVYAAQTPAALSLSLAAELWSAARFLASVVRGVMAISDGDESSALRRRLMGAAYTAALIVFILANLTLLFFGENLLSLVRAAHPELEGLWHILLRLRGVVFLAGLTAVNALLFCYAPQRRVRLVSQLPGAAFSAAVWLCFSRLYSWALERFGLFGVYGSLAAVVISLIWMYCSIYILLLGVWLNTWLEKERRA